jgi:outer membrane biosynthesis protein TonB
MHSVRLGTRFGFLTGTALALILTVSITASAAPPNSSQMQPPHPVARDYSTPGSMPKPSTTMDDGIRFRGTLPASNSTPTPLAPASIELRNEPAKPVATAKPVTAPEPARAEAEPEAVVAPPEPVAKFAPPPAPVSRPIAVPVPAPEPAPRPVAAPAPAPESVARSVLAPAPAARPGSVPPRPVAVEAPAANAATEAEVSNKLREIITGKQFDRMVARKPDRDAIVALYQKARNFQPLWVAQGAASERAKDVIEYLGTIDADGLDPKDYRMPKLNVGSAEEQAQAELKFTETLLTYARHAMTGRVHFSRVSPNIDYKLAFDADDVLKKIAASNDLGKTLAQFNPPQPGYRTLKAKLAEMRDALDEPVSSRVENGPVLRYTRDSRGKETVMADPRVPLLRERLGLAAEPNSNYNAALAMAVANMERWRWMPRDLGKTT